MVEEGQILLRSPLEAVVLAERANAKLDTVTIFPPTSHQCLAFGRRLLLSLVGGLAFVAPAALRRCHQGAVFAVRREYTMEVREVDPDLRN